MWGVVFIFLLLSAIVFYLLSNFQGFINREGIYDKASILYNRKQKQMLVLHPDKTDFSLKYSMLRELYRIPRNPDEPVGLQQFNQPVNSILYSYSMLLLVSLPKLPTGWSLRVFTGWYWLYCLLVVVAYRASMTAILARPNQRVTIDTLQELIDSKLSYGGWGEMNRMFFKSFSDQYTKTIGKNFELVNDSSIAIEEVAQGHFAFYENTYFLKEAAVKMQLQSQLNTVKSNESFVNQTENSRANMKPNEALHIMRDCVIKMPISVGLQRNSPIKQRIDTYMRRVVEAGLVTKWLDDVMQPILNAELYVFRKENAALMDMHKLHGALFALFIGYIVSIVFLSAEILYKKYTTYRGKSH